ncbi:polymer-forming cytoskeletal protein [Patescibacteria group bacterium]|nr:polymer-forming cytoskeletal protein [Patescibacteria group bacterium]
MKNTTKLVLLSLIMFSGWLLLPAPAAAFQFKSQDSYRLDSKSVVNESLVVSGNDVNIQGKVDGDLICAGKNVTVTGPVTGDIICAGQNININNLTGGNLRLAGQTVNVSGKVTKNSTLFGQLITFAPTASISGELLAGAETLTDSGTVGKNLQAWAQTIHLNGQVNGSANLTGNTIALATTASILGDLTYQSKQSLIFPPVVKGKTEFHQINYDLPTVSTPSSVQVRDAFLVMRTVFRAFIFIISLIMGSLFVLLFPGFFEKSSAILSNGLGESLKWGVIISLLAFLIFFVLLISLIGIPLALTFVPLWVLFVFIADLSAAVYLGRLLVNQGSLYFAFIVGLLILTVVRQIPVVGWFVSFLLTWFGIGSVYLAWRQK